MKTEIKTSLLLALIMISAQAFSQIEIGPQLGMSASTQSEPGNIWNDEDLCCGINTGILARYQTNDWFALKTGILFNQKGRKMNDSDEKYRINYLELPVKAEFSGALQSGKASRIFFATGPYVATRLKAERKKNGITSDLKNDTDATDAGWSFELGFQFPVAKQKLQLSLNYDMGLKEVYKTQDDIKK